MNYILFDDHTRHNLFPLTFTRPIADLRTGIFTIREKWQQYLEHSLSTLTVNYLKEKYPAQLGNNNLFIQGGVIPNPTLVKEIQKLAPQESLTDDNKLIAVHLTDTQVEQYLTENTLLPLQQIQNDCKNIPTESSPLQIRHWYDLFSKNEATLRSDYQIQANQRQSAEPSRNTTLIGDDIFIESGAEINCATINAKQGPVYIGKNAEIMEGAHIRGPFALCDNSVVKLGAKIYGPTTIGPYSKVGGEINHSVITGYSNKAHDGFLGNAVLGEWCNIGADSNNSNLKNNYSNVKVWNYEEETFKDTGLQFCGLVMGDHAKCGINTMFNTGTTVGVFANIFNAGFPRTFLPSFSWGGAKRLSTYKLEKTFEVAERVMPRRNKKLTTTDKNILENIFKLTAKYRR